MMVTMSTSSHRARKPSRRRPPRPYHHGDLRRALVAAALELVRSRGPEGFALREAARRVGVSQTAPYRHFPTKEALLAAVAEEGFRALRARLEAVAAASPGPDPLPRLRALGEASFEFYVADAARFRVMFGPAAARKDRHPALARAWESVNALLLDALVACQRAGEIRDGDPIEIGLTTAAMVHGLAGLVAEGQLGDAASDRGAALEIYRRARAILFEGLRPTRRDPA
jgi:AcrR family transcriptional regulator